MFHEGREEHLHGMAGPATDRSPWLEHVESKLWRAFIGARALVLVDLLELSLEQFWLTNAIQMWE